MKKILFPIISLFFFLCAFQAKAAGSCRPSFGGGSTCQTNSTLAIDEKIQNPQTNTFVDTLSVQDAQFTPGQTVTIHITVSHPGNGTVKNITVRNIFPEHVQFTSGRGMYDTDANVLSFTIDQLQAKESKTYTVKGRIDTAQNLPQTTPAVCLINGATAQSGNTLVQDNSQFCVTQTLAGTQQNPSQNAQQVPNQTKGGLTVYAPQAGKTTPATGPEALGLVALLPVGGLGVFLRRKSR